MSTKAVYATATTSAVRLSIADGGTGISRDTLSHVSGQGLMRKLQQHLILVLGGVLLVGVIAWVVNSRYRIEN